MTGVLLAFLDEASKLGDSGAKGRGRVREGAGTGMHEVQGGVGLVPGEAEGVA